MGEVQAGLARGVRCDDIAALYDEERVSSIDKREG
jgi:hypothetical protein